MAQYLNQTKLAARFCGREKCTSTILETFPYETNSIWPLTTGNLSIYVGDIADHTLYIEIRGRKAYLYTRPSNTTVHGLFIPMALPLLGIGSNLEPSAINSTFCSPHSARISTLKRDPVATPFCLRYLAIGTKAMSVNIPRLPQLVC